MGTLGNGDPDRIGPYELLGYLGRGGQGVVYRGRHPDGGLVAIKRLHPGMADDDKSRARFMREAESARRVAGFCTAQVIATGVADNAPYIVSEYIQGESLQKRVDSEGPRSAAQMERLMVGTLTALSAIHQAGIVHRDFKPSNVLLSDDGPRVVDFGIAQVLGEGTSLSGPMGTPAYMAPEQFSGQTDQSTDVFAWAATMYFAATGQQAFGTGNPPEIMFRVLHKEPDLTLLPDAMRPMLTQCLQKDPALRPDATTLLLAMLGARGHVDGLGPKEALVQGQTMVKARTGDLGPKPAGAFPRRRFLLALGGGTVAVGGAALLLNSSRQEQGRPTNAGSSPSAYTSTPVASLERSPLRVLRGHNDMVGGVCFGEIGEKVVLISASDDGTVRVWDPALGGQHGPSLTGHKGWVSSVGFTEFDDVPYAVSAAEDGKLKLWNLNSMEEHATLPAHDDWMRSFCVGRFKGEPIAVTCSGDQTVKVWDLRAGRQTGKTIKGFGTVVSSVTLSERNYKPVILVGDADGHLTMWDLATHQKAGRPIPAHRAQINTMACGEYEGRAVVFTAGDDMVVRGWDVDSGIQKWSFSGHSQIIFAVTFGILDGRNVVISGADDGSIRIWDLATAKEYGRPLQGHRGGVRALAVSVINGVTSIVSAGRDQSIRIWGPQ
jgi:tRNA A-37 threonylcarbamoyl transferase component Bud32